MQLRNLRISWSLAWGAVALILCLLWVRSYWRADHVVHVDASAVTTHVCTDAGVLFFTRSELSAGDDPFSKPGWRHTTRVPTGTSASHQNLKSYWDDKDISLRVPLVSAVFFIVVAGTIPWIPFNRTSYRRFSLSVLLVATTLVAVALGLFIWLR